MKEAHEWVKKYVDRQTHPKPAPSDCLKSFQAGILHGAQLLRSECQHADPKECARWLERKAKEIKYE